MNYVDRFKDKVDDIFDFIPQPTHEIFKERILRYRPCYIFYCKFRKRAND